MTHKANQWDTHAKLFDTRMGSGGDDLHTKIIDPLILSYVGTPKGKSFVDLGCGNGYLAGKLAGFASYTGVDSSEELLTLAVNRVGALKHTHLVHADISSTMPVAEASADVVLCNMVLQYVPALTGVVSETERILKPGGTLALIIDHPAHLLFVRAEELAGKPSEKFIHPKSYFLEGKRTKNSLWGKAVLSYYHRTVSTYVNAFSQYFRLDRLDEVSEDKEMPRILGMKWRKA